MTAAAMPGAVSIGPGEAGNGFLLCFNMSGLGIMDPEASLPRDTRTLVPSSRYRMAAFTGEFVTGSMRLTLE